MRRTLPVLLMLMLCAPGVRAQSATPTVTPTPLAEETPQRRGIMKMVLGAGLFGFGALVASTANDTTTVTSPVGSVVTTTRSGGQLATGLLMLGAGGYLVWDGRREYQASGPSTQLALSVGPHAGGVFVHRRW